jgi:hypothetical protein
VVVSDFESDNTALNPNVKFDVVDLTESKRTAYVQAIDGSWGLKLVFKDGGFNRLKLYDRVRLDLNGCRVAKVDGTDALYVTDLTPLNVVSCERGTAEGVTVKEKFISELTSKDLFTRVTVKDIEFVFRDGAFVNIAEFHGQYVPEIHAAYKDKMISNCDGACCVLRDAQGKSIYMAVNTKCAWAREAAPQGIGSLSGVLVWERNRRYGDRQAKYYIRPMFREDIAVDMKKKSALWKHYIAWLPEKIDGNNFDFENAGFGPEGINDRLLNNVGPLSYLSYNAGNGKIRKAGSYNSLLSRDGSGNVSGGSIKTYATLNQWYQWGADGEIAGTNSIFVEFSTAKIKATQLQFAFDICGSDGNLLSCRGLPARWKVEYSVNDGEFVALREGDDERGVRLHQELQHLQIVFGGLVPHVDELDDQGDVPIGREVAVDHLPPAVALRIGGLRVAVARKVDQFDPISLIKVDGDGLPRLRADAGQLFAVQYFVDQ